MYLGALLGLLQSAVPLYGLRLKRLFGLQRVGWALVGVFLALALAHLAGGWSMGGIWSASEPARSITYGVIPLLLLIGMGHIETLFRERAREEQEEKRRCWQAQEALNRKTEELAHTAEWLQTELERREEQQQAIAKAAEQYRLMIMENPEPMWVFDLRTLQLLEANNAALTHFGYTREEFLAKTAKDLCPREEADWFVEETARLSLALPTQRLVRCQTSTRQVLESQAKMVDLMYDNRPARLVYLNGAREGELKDNSKSNRKYELTAQVAAGAAQHFNRHLAVLKVYANVLLRKGFDARTNEQHIRISAVVGEAARLGERLLACGSRRPMHGRALNLAEVIRERISMLRRMAPAEVVIENYCPPDLPPVLADPGLCESILEQLVKNAGEAAGTDGSIRISADPVEVSAEYARHHVEAQIGRFVRLSIADDGCGMSEEAQEHLFEPFFTTKEASKHAGLGLASVQGLMKEQAGWVQVENQPGSGTTVHLFFPRTEA
jgi:two-component system, cell cycle sensor histidine kinase and response regulator CckA